MRIRDWLMMAACAAGVMAAHVRVARYEKDTRDEIADIKHYVLHRQGRTSRSIQEANLLIQQLQAQVRAMQLESAAVDAMGEGK